MTQTRIKLIKNLDSKVSISQLLASPAFLQKNEEDEGFVERFLGDGRRLRVLQLESSGAAIEDDFPSQEKKKKEKKTSCIHSWAACHSDGPTGCRAKVPGEPLTVVRFQAEQILELIKPQPPPAPPLPRRGGGDNPSCHHRGQRGGEGRVDGRFKMHGFRTESHSGTLSKQ